MNIPKRTHLAKWPFAFAIASALALAGCGGGQGGRTSSQESATASPSASEASAQAQAAIDRLAVGLAFEPYRSQILLPQDLVGSGAAERGAGFRFTIVAGALPEGLTLDAATGVISGRPARAGTHAFEVQVDLPDGSSSRRRLTLYVNDSNASASAALGLPVSAEGGRKRVAAVADTPDLSSIGSIVVSMPEGSWRKVNVNAFSDVWTPTDLRPLYGWSNPSPERIIAAWSGFAWDEKRAALVLYGGGHANYRGNDTYIWRASTMRWERGSLPSEMVAAPVTGTIQAADGGLNAPASAHTYDNTIYLRRADRVLVLGGASDPGGGHFVMEEAGVQRVTGPYLFDASRANANQVGGTTGSHVQRVAPYPEIVGGQMWQNRDSWRYASSTSQPPGEALVNGCSGVAEESGRDVVYVRTAYRLYRYALGDLATPASDVWSQVGTYWYGGSGSQTACAFEPQRRVMLATHTDPNRPFIFWNLSDPSQLVRDNLVTPTDLDGTFMPAVANGSLLPRDCGFKHDPVRGDFKLWCGTGDVWSLKAPSLLGTSGWTIAKEPSAGAAPVPTESIGTGILGKWKYVPNLDVFIGLADSVLGNVWIYKPRGWVSPGVPTNAAPAVSLTAPTSGATLTLGQAATLAATASDSDGTVVRVRFYDGATLLGETTAAPHTLSWVPASAGARTLTAVAYDDGGAQTTSAGVAVTVTTPAVNVAPTIALTAPASGATLTLGQPTTLAATALDSDGTVVRVRFYDDTTLLGESNAAPYRLMWTPTTAGSHSLTAVATDDGGASTTSAADVVIVQEPTTSTTNVTIQRGSGVSVVRDTFLSSHHLNQSFGSQVYLQDIGATTYTPLLRFAIFASDGGPVPDGAQIISAKLSVYKYTSYDMTYALHRVLVDWNEPVATWKRRVSGANWAALGANGAGSDVAASPETTASIGWSEGWLTFDVTNSVVSMASGQSLNFGWRMKAVSGTTSQLKRFHSSDSPSTSLRPKLEITFR